MPIGAVASVPGLQVCLHDTDWDVTGHDAGGMQQSLCQ